MRCLSAWSEAVMPTYHHQHLAITAHGFHISLNPFTLRVSLESIVCYFHTFENNLGIKEKFSKYLKGSCCLTTG